MFIEDLHKLFLECDTISINSREIPTLVKEGHKVMFFAIKGDNFDGNDYALDALNNGASYVIVNKMVGRISGQIIEVKDTLKTLQALAHLHRHTLNIPIIAVTGSNGKTTTKELMAAVLGKKYKTIATKGNLNNHLGVPLTLLSINEEHEIAIVEMGANHRTEIAALASIAAPNYGIITNIGKAHLEGFGGEEGVVKGKGELYDHLDACGGTAIYNQDIEKVNTLIQKYKNIKKVAYTTSDVKCFHESGFLEVASDNYIIHSRLIGDYNAFNIATAYAVGEYFGVNKSDIISAIEDYTPSNNRSQLTEIGSNRFIIDAYNANPSSMRLSIENFKEMKGAHKIAIVGDMKELGEYSLNEHIEIIKLLECSSLENVIFVGDEFAKALKGYTPTMKHLWFKDVEGAKENIQNLTDTLILVKGSNSTCLHKIL
ncbi:MAG: UDP-N-acetylmuramoyl-tripeptide--D-alanyl-D-alanine ligase [Rikenellaceae bacterium]